MLPLEEIIVLDMCRGYPGALTTRFLADFGAEVIRVDPPPNSILGIKQAEERRAAFLGIFRNKKSIVLDLKKVEGKKVLYKLVKKADVLVEGFRPGVMNKLGAGYNDIREINPRLIYCSLSGFGQYGPYSERPAHDMNYIAIAGALSLIGQRNGPPYLPSNIIADYGGAAMHALAGILIALLARQKTGLGQFVDIAYLDSVISLMQLDTFEYFMTGEVPRRGETARTGAHPWTNVYKCSDGEYITIACIEPQFWDALCKILHIEELNKYPRDSYTPEELNKITKQLANIFATKSRYEWCEFFKGKEICYGPVNYLNETFNDPQVKCREMVVELSHPKLGKVRQSGLPIKLSETPGKISSLGVVSGTNSREILVDMGYTDNEIESLLESHGVIQQLPDS